MRHLACVLLLVACGEREINGTACASETDCNLFNAQGTCEATGFCSYPDATCLGGQRYAPGAGEGLGGSCVGDQTCGMKDQTCCAGTVCADNLVCTGADTTMTCQCGGAGQPCCDGTTCTTGLHCGNGATCSSNDVEQVAVAAGYTCALTADEAVWCWGVDVMGYKYRAPNQTAVIDYERPTRIANIENVAELRAGEDHVCAKKSDGTLWCWGHNWGGQLGNGTTTPSSAAVPVSGLSNVTKYEVGRAVTCALGTVGAVTALYCWGRGGIESRTVMTPTGSRLGTGSAADSNTPVAVDLSAAATGGATVKTFSVGGYHSCVVMSNDAVWCWGRNDSGLGDGTTTRSLVPVQVNLTGITIPQGVTIDAVVCNDGRRKTGHTCIRLSDASVYCWGSNGNGELGDGGTTARTTPSTPLSTTDLAGAKLVALVSGAKTRCARSDANEVWCWGENRSGSVGNNGTIDTDFPTVQKVMGLSGVMQLDMSHQTACAIDAQKQLWCWGNNRHGQVMGHLPTMPSEDTVMVPFHLVL